MKRILINNIGSSNKMWTVEELDNNSIKVQWGRIGQTGQSQIKNFTSAYTRSRWIDSKVSEKLSEGYVEQDQESLDKEVRTAEGLGSQYKIARMEFIKEATNRELLFGDEYIPGKGVYVEIMNSWSRDITYLYLTKNNSWRLSSVSRRHNCIYYSSKVPDVQYEWVKTIRNLIKETAKAVSVIVTQAFGAIGVRTLSFGDEDEEIQKVVTEAHKLPSASAIGDQLLIKFATLGARELEI